MYTRTCIGRSVIVAVLLSRRALMDCVCVDLNAVFLLSTPCMAGSTEGSWLLWYSCW